MLNNRPTNLQHFCFHGDDDDDDPRVSIEIGNNIKTLRSIDISHCLFSVSHNKRLKCARLTRLSLTGVHLSTESFSCTKIHSLEELKLNRCSGIKKFKLSSPSMKRLVIHNISNKPFRVTVDAPSIVSFHYEGILPQSISFAGPTTCSDNLWKSRIILGSSVDGHDNCFNELYDLLKASSQSEVSLELGIIDIPRLRTQIPIGDNRLPLVVEHLTINTPDRNAHFNAAAAFLNMLFGMFRPSFVYLDTDMLKDSNNKHSEMAELLFKEREPAWCYIWQHVLEGVTLQFKYNRKQKDWQPVEHTSFTDVGKKGKEIKYRIHLKWRD